MNQPVRIAPRVFLHPPGRPELPPGALGLPALPSAAFGDGSHPTTRLCAGAVDVCCRLQRPRALLDVGTGSGVLARLARARGVPRVVATDTNPVALAAARANFALDDQGSEWELSSLPPHSWGPRFDLVVANIHLAVLVELSASLVAALAPGGLLLVSGLLRPQAPVLRAELASRGLRFDLQAHLEEWALLQLGKPDHPST